MSDVNEIAKKLIPCTCGGYGQDKRRHMTDCPRHAIAWEDIAAALASERAKFAAFADEKGEPRKVLGTLPLTADGFIAGDGAYLVHKGFEGDTDPHGTQHQRTARVQAWAWHTAKGTNWATSVSDCYSTRESATSALAAAKEQR